MAIVFQSAKFYFQDGKKRYFVTYRSDLKRWYVFDWYTDRALNDYGIGKANPRINPDIARNYLERCLREQKQK